MIFRAEQSAQIWAQILANRSTLFLRQPFTAKKRSQLLARFCLQHAAHDLDTMIVARIAEQIEDATNGTGLWVIGRKNQARNTRMKHRPDAHHAWLQAAVERRADQAMIANSLACLTHRHDFRVGTGIEVEDVAIVPTTDDLSV